MAPVFELCPISIRVAEDDQSGCVVLWDVVRVRRQVAKLGGMAMER